MSEKWERWSKEELAILKEHYPISSREVVLELLLGRTWRAICNTAQKHEIRRPRYGTVRSTDYLKSLHDKLSTARRNRTGGYAPFAGNHHSADAKLRISVSNLHTRGHSIAEIVRRKGIADGDVKGIIKERSKKR